MADAKTVGDGIEELREVCGRFVRFAGDESGKGMATWMAGCAGLIREIIAKALAVHPDGIEVITITDLTYSRRDPAGGFPSEGFRVGTKLYVVPPEEGAGGQ